MPGLKLIHANQKEMTDIKQATFTCIFLKETFCILDTTYRNVGVRREWALMS